MHDAILHPLAAIAKTAGGSVAERANAAAIRADKAAAKAEGRAHAGGGRPSTARPIVAALILLAAVNIAGAPYYLSAPGERVRSAMHPWLRPSGFFGQSAGILSFALFAFIWLYPLRKKLEKLVFLGRVGRWLDLHIAAGLVLPLLAATHAAWHFSGLIGLGYAAMLVVSMSGIVGRYLYVRIPRGKEGLELSAEEIRQERSRLLEGAASATGMPRAEIERRLTVDTAASRGLAGLFPALIRDDLARRRATRSFLREMRRSGTALDRAAMRTLAGLIRREVALGQQMRLLDLTQSAFRYWHVAHRPIAITAFLAVLAHIAVSVWVGATWFR